MRIETFHIQNFRSISDLLVDFSYQERQAPRNYRSSDQWVFLEDPNGKRLIPCLAVFGANASGKSNIVQALAVFCQMILEVRHPSAQMRYQPNRLLHPDTETQFTLVFSDAKHRYSYSLAYADDGIHCEILTIDQTVFYQIDSHGLKTDHLATDFYTEVKLREILKVECAFDGSISQTPFLRCLAHGYSGLNEDVNQVFKSIQSMLVFGMEFKPIMLKTAIDLLAAEKGFSREEAIDLLVNYVRDLDGAIHHIYFKDTLFGNQSSTRIEHVAPTSHYPQIISVHKNAQGEDVEFHFLQDESEGTQRLFVLIAFILIALERGAPLFADEMERSLHPILMREILTFFKKKRLNPNGAQLFFTTHMTDILDDTILRRTEVALLVKSLRQGTTIEKLWDLCQEPDNHVKNLSNFRENYLRGYYRGIPYPAL